MHLQTSSTAQFINRVKRPNHASVGLTAFTQAYAVNQKVLIQMFYAEFINICVGVKKTFDWK